MVEKHPPVVLPQTYFIIELVCLECVKNPKLVLDIIWPDKLLNFEPVRTSSLRLILK
jgi:hypothetical protein